MWISQLTPLLLNRLELTVSDTDIVKGVIGGAAFTLCSANLGEGCDRRSWVAERWLTGFPVRFVFRNSLFPIHKAHGSAMLWFRQEASGRKYYLNVATQETSWTKPAGYIEYVESLACHL